MYNQGMTNNYTLHLGDCLEILPTLRTASVDLVIADPPYILAAVSNTHMNGKAGTWGDMMNTAYWFTEWQNQCLRILKPDGAMWTFCNWKTIPVLMKSAISTGGGITSMLVWDKEWIGPGGQQGLRPRYEMVALTAKEQFGIRDRGISDITNCMWSAIKPNGHPAEKPVDLLRRLLRICEMAGKTLLDPFMGSGSTGEAAMIEKCDYIGIETDEYWHGYARKRIEAAAAQPLLFIPEKQEEPAQLTIGV
jgi:site-specific DNA-methyltransferase (adenine-specific)